MESKNKFTMCRLCLCENECFIKMFELNDWQGYVAAEVISDLLQVQVSESDGYPHVVCSTCLTKLTDFKLFKEFCQKSTVTYDKMFISSKKLVKHQPETPIIKQEELDISGDESDKSFEVTNTQAGLGPILLKHEVLPFNHDIDPLELDESETSENIGVKHAVSSMENFTQEGVSRSAQKKGVGGGRGKFECHHCKKLLSRKSILKSHLVTHGIGKGFKCTVCGKTFGRNSDLNNHARSHSGEKPYKCTVCTARFTQISNLYVHMRIHSESRPFSCQKCNLTFRVRHHLTRHMSIHLELRPFQCEVCHENFRLKTTLTSHMISHSGIWPYKCDICSKGFTRITSLKRHLSIHTTCLIDVANAENDLPERKTQNAP